MNMSKEKRNQLILVAIITIAVLVLIGFTFIHPQLQTLSKIGRTKGTLKPNFSRSMKPSRHTNDCGNGIGTP